MASYQSGPRASPSQYHEDSCESNKSRILRVRESGIQLSNEKILILLQNFGMDVEDTINNCIEDQGEKYLNEWKCPSDARSKKNKKRRDAKQTQYETCSSSGAVDKHEPPQTNINKHNPQKESKGRDNSECESSSSSSVSRPSSADNRNECVPHTKVDPGKSEVVRPSTSNNSRNPRRKYEPKTYHHVESNRRIDVRPKYGASLQSEYRPSHFHSRNVAHSVPSSTCNAPKINRFPLFQQHCLGYEVESRNAGSNKDGRHVSLSTSSASKNNVIDPFPHYATEERPSSYATANHVSVTSKPRHIDVELNVAEVELKNYKDQPPRLQENASNVTEVCSSSSDISARPESRPTKSHSSPDGAVINAMQPFPYYHDSSGAGLPSNKSAQSAPRPTNSELIDNKSVRPEPLPNSHVSGSDKVQSGRESKAELRSVDFECQDEVFKPPVQLNFTSNQRRQPFNAPAPCGDVTQPSMYCNINGERIPLNQQPLYVEPNLGNVGQFEGNRLEEIVRDNSQVEVNGALSNVQGQPACNPEQIHVCTTEKHGVHGVLKKDVVPYPINPLVCKEDAARTFGDLRRHSSFLHIRIDDLLKKEIGESYERIQYVFRTFRNVIDEREEEMKRQLIDSEKEARDLLEMRIEMLKECQSESDLYPIMGAETFQGFRSNVKKLIAERVMDHDLGSHKRFDFCEKSLESLAIELSSFGRIVPLKNTYEKKLDEEGKRGQISRCQLPPVSSPSSVTSTLSPISSSGSEHGKMCNTETYNDETDKSSPNSDTVSRPPSKDGVAHHAKYQGDSRRVSNHRGRWHQNYGRNSRNSHRGRDHHRRTSTPRGPNSYYDQPKSNPNSNHYFRE